MTVVHSNINFTTTHTRRLLGVYVSVTPKDSEFQSL